MIYLVRATIFEKERKGKLADEEEFKRGQLWERVANAPLRVHSRIAVGGAVSGAAGGKGPQVEGSEAAEGGCQIHSLVMGLAEHLKKATAVRRRGTDRKNERVLNHTRDKRKIPE